MTGETDLGAILARLSLERRDEPVTMISLPEGAETPEPGDGILALIQEPEGLTVVATVDRAEREAWPHEFIASWLTVRVQTSLEGVGLTAAMAEALTEYAIPCNVIAGFHHDHLLVPIERTDDALAALHRLAEPLAYKPTLVGESVTLRPVRAHDAEAMWHDLQDTEALRLTGTHADFTRDQIDQWCAERSDQPDRLDLAVTDGTTGEWLGEVVINEWDSSNRSCSFRIALAAAARDRGVGTEATRLIVDYMFDEIDANRIELEVYAFNPRALAVYERVGFVREGVRRQALLWEGEYVDAIVMSIIAADRNP